MRIGRGRGLGENTGDIRKETYALDTKWIWDREKRRELLCEEHHFSTSSHYRTRLDCMYLTVQK